MKNKRGYACANVMRASHKAPSAAACNHGTAQALRGAASKGLFICDFLDVWVGGNDARCQ